MGIFNKLELPCIYLGPPTGEVRDCEACGGKKAVPVFACAKYGRCSPGDRLVYREEGRNVEVAWCRTCPDYFNPQATVAAPIAGFPGVKVTRPGGSIQWLISPQPRPAIMTMREAVTAGLMADPTCNGCTCGATGVQTNCCPGNLTPLTLHMTISGTGSCDGTYAVTYKPALSNPPTLAVWDTSPFGTCSGGDELGVKCTTLNGGLSYVWIITVGRTDSAQTLTIASCNPLSLNNTASGADPVFQNCCTSSGLVSVAP